MSAENAEEKGFNDDELADIMSEIETLEEDLNKSSEEESSPSDGASEGPEVSKSSERPKAALQDEGEEKEEKEEIEAEAEAEEDLNVVAISNGLSSHKSDESEKNIEQKKNPRQNSQEAQSFIKGLESLSCASTESKNWKREHQNIQKIIDDQIDKKLTDVVDDLMDESDVQEIHREASAFSSAPSSGSVSPSPVVSSAPQVSSDSDDTKMSFNLSGQMNFGMEIIVNNETLNFKMDKKKGLVIEMQNGATFSVPLAKK